MPKAKHVVVTGGGRGIGAATARRFKSLGYRVTVMARNRTEIETLADEIEAYAVRVDVGDPASVEAAFMAAGPVDVLVNNAGMVRPSLVTKTDVRVWEEHLKVNLTGAFLCSLKVLPGMTSRGRGRIINVAGTYGLRGEAYMAAYCASKAGLLGFTKALSAEVGANGVTVNAVCPGFVDSPLMEVAIQNLEERSEASRDDIVARLRGRSPQNRMFGVDEVADAIAYLASPGASGINGQTLVLDGGELAS
ncbi:MAG: 3-hydroxyacyl-CoA dehydrogenase [Deltaproteobacteria bacterium]|nr:3-hydroxyacyl-CoA dehydrogenase [Deltaproteobacteria bacterium]HCH66173.1 3-hydroxyacyl-CoA dehydrogenase [Deltaproteobacteria bacterium]